SRVLDHHDRLLLAKLMVEDPGQSRVGALGQSPGVVYRAGLLGVVIDLEVFGLQDPPVERVVLDLVLTEVVLSAERRAVADERDDQRDQRPPNAQRRARNA